MYNNVLLIYKIKRILQFVLKYSAHYHCLLLFNTFLTYQVLIYFHIQSKHPLIYTKSIFKELQMFTSTCDHRKCLKLHIIVTRIIYSVNKLRVITRKFRINLRKIGVYSQR